MSIIIHAVYHINNLLLMVSVNQESRTADFMIEGSSLYNLSFTRQLKVSTACCKFFIFPVVKE